MRRNNNESLSAWQAIKQDTPTYPTLDRNIDVDVCVVGAGIAGLTTGYLLQSEGKSVAILDSWQLAAGETSRTTAHLTAVLDDRFFKLESLFGQSNTKLACESHL